MALTHKRRVFIEEYLRCWNATEAARIAGYKHPRRMGSFLLSIHDIDAAIKQRISEKAMGADEVVTRLAEHARGDIANGLNIDGTFTMVDIEKLKQLGLTHLIKKFKQTKTGVELEFYDAQAALVHLGKVHGLFVDRQKVDHSGQLQIEYVNDWRTAED